jgi:hypothetical protein
MAAFNMALSGYYLPESLEENMLQRSYSRVIAAITFFLSVAIVTAAAHVGVAHAQSRAACGAELKKQCSGVSVFGNNALECLKRDRQKLSPRCAKLADNVVRSCDRDAAQLCQGVFMGQGQGLECLTTARRSVSPRCNAALDAAFLRR